MPHAENVPATPNRPPELDMTYDQLAAQRGMRSEQMRPGKQVDIDLRAVEPVAYSGGHRVVAATKIEGPDGAQELNVWASRTQSGTTISLARAGADPVQEGGGFRGYAVAKDGGVGYFRQPRTDTEKNNIDRLGAIPPATLQNSSLVFGLSADGKTLSILDHSEAGNRTSLLHKEAAGTATNAVAPSALLSRGETTAPRRALETTGPRPDSSARMAGTSAMQGAVERSDLSSSARPYESDSAQGRRRHIYEGAAKDPDYQAVAEPHRKQLAEYKEKYEAERTRLESQKQNASPERASEINGSLTRLQHAYDNAVGQERNRFETAIKPVLAERLRLSGYDKNAGYQSVGRLEFDSQTYRAELINSESKKRITNEPPKLGAVTLPDRFQTWAGSDKEKFNEATGKKTNSSEHIVNIAAAKVAGKWDAAKASKDPIVISRDYDAETALPRDWPSLQLWKVEIGQHRVAAARLLYGIDVAIPYDQIKDTPDPYARTPRR